MQMLTTEAAQAEIISKDLTSLETVPSLPSIDQSLQRLPQQALWHWQLDNYHWLRIFGRFYNRQGENSVSEIAFHKMGEVVFGTGM